MGIMEIVIALFALSVVLVPIVVGIAMVVQKRRARRE